MWAFMSLYMTSGLGQMDGVQGKWPSRQNEEIWKANFDPRALGPPPIGLQTNVSVSFSCA